MRAPLPRNIKIGALDYRLRPTPDLRILAGSASMNAYVAALATTPDGVFQETTVLDLLGLTNADEQIIRFESAHAGPDVQAATVLHETLHACLSQAGIRDIIDEISEESIVKRLAPLLLQVIRENPKLIEYLTNRRLLGKGSVY